MAGEGEQFTPPIADPVPYQFANKEEVHDYIVHIWERLNHDLPAEYLPRPRKDGDGSGERILNAWGASYMDFLVTKTPPLSLFQTQMLVLSNAAERLLPTDSMPDLTPEELRKAHLDRDMLRSIMYLLVKNNRSLLRKGSEEDKVLYSEIMTRVRKQPYKHTKGIGDGNEITERQIHILKLLDMILVKSA